MFKENLGKMNTKGKIMQFKLLVEYNDKAVGSLEDLADFRRYTPEEIIGLYNSAVNNIINMGLVYCEICDVQFGSLRPTIDRLIETSFPAVQNAVIAAKIGASTSDAVYNTARDNILKKLCAVSDDFIAQDFKVECVFKVQTPHELVRYLHQKTIQAMLELNLENGANLEGHKRREINFDKARFFITDIGGAFKSAGDVYDSTECTPLRAILDFYRDPKSRKKEGHEIYSGIATRESLNASTDMGCHNADVKARITADGSGSIKFKYRDTTGYDCSKERAEIFKRIAQRLGYSITKKEHIVEGSFSSNEPGQAYKLLTETARLFASVKNVDNMHGCKGKIKEHMDQIVEEFLKGAVNLNKYIQSSLRRIYW